MALPDRIRALAPALFASIAFGALPDTALADSFGALWHMDEEAGATAMVDSSGNGNHGVPTGILFGQPSPWGTAYGFDGTSSWVTVPDSPSLNPGDGDFSFTVSLNVTDIPATDYDVLRKGLSSTPGGDYKLEIVKKVQGTVARAACHFDGSVASSTISAQPHIADGLWHTITCTKTSTGIAITLDGVTTSKSVAVGAIANDMPVWLGMKFRRMRALDRFLGEMDEVSIQRI